MAPTATEAGSSTDQLAKLVEAYASLPSGVELKLSAGAASGGVSHLIRAHAIGQLPNAGEVAKMRRRETKIRRASHSRAEGRREGSAR